MASMQQNIRDFLTANKVATVCFNDKEGHPYCISCFFVFVEDSEVLVLKSSFGTSHDNIILNSCKVSGTVLPDELDSLKIQGIQFTGRTVDQLEMKTAFTTAYYKKYPFGLAMAGYVWAIRLEYIKFTDNTLVFGNKTIWRKEPAEGS